MRVFYRPQDLGPSDEPWKYAVTPAFQRRK
jgi:hypothetical protein